MPGQGFHLSVGKMYCGQQGKEMTNEFILGVLVPDALNSVMGGRRFSHFCGGAGCVLPQLDELKTLTPEKVKVWDTGEWETYITDPPIDLWMFGTMNSREGDYYEGLACHYVADYLYDQLIRQHLFGVAHQDEGYLIYWPTGEKVTEKKFRQDVYGMYPALDQMCYEMAGLTRDDIEYVKRLLRQSLRESQAEFLCKYLNYDENLKWEDTRFFKKRDLLTTIHHSVQFPDVMEEVMRRR